MGSHVVEQALAAGHEVEVLDDLSVGKRENLPDGVPLHVADVRDADEVDRIVGGFRPHVVSHQAAQTRVPASFRDPGHDAAVNILGSLHVLEACLAHGVRRFVFASSGGAIFGEVPEGAAAEDTRPAPRTPYGAAKLAVEAYLGSYRDRGLACVSLRYANVYGPRQDLQGEAGVVAVFTSRALAGRPLAVFGMHRAGDGGGVRDYVYVGDVARINVGAMSDSFRHEVVSVATGVATTSADLARAVVKSAGVEVEVHDEPPRAGDVARSVLAAPTFLREVGPLVPLDEGLRRTVNAFRPRPTR